MNFDRLIDISHALFNPKEHSTRTFHTTFILKKGRIQSIGVNSNKTTPKNLRFNYSKGGVDLRHFVKTHSEMSSIIKYGREDCSDCFFVNIRIDRNGKVRNSRPCEGCFHCLNQVGYKRLYFTNDNGVFEEYALS